MKKIIAILFLFILGLQVKAADVVELKLPKSDLVVVKLMFKNGSICDPVGKEGLTSLTASVIEGGGTSKMTSSQIKDLIYPWAASYYASVDKQVTVFTFEVHKDHLDKFYPVIIDLLISPRFADDDFSRIKSNQLNYVSEVIHSSSDEEYSKKYLENFLFRGTNMAHLVDGTAEGVNSITLNDVKSHYKNFFGTNNLTIGIAGNYSDAFLTNLKNDLGGLAKTAMAIPEPGKGRKPNGIQVEIVSKESALGSAVFAGFPMELTRANDDFAALMIANSWLGEHRKSYSRLYQKIREQRSMNYGDYTYIEWYNNGGGNMLPRAGYPRLSNYFSIWLRPVQTAKGLKGQYPELKDIEVGHAHFALRMALREMSNMISNGMSKEDFELTRTFLRSYMKLYAQTPEQQLGYLLDSKFYGRKDWLKEADALLANLTVEQVNAVMKKYWQTNNMFIAIVTDKSEAVPLARSLRDNLVSPMSYSNTLKGVMTNEILTEDKEVEKFPMKVTSVVIIDDATTFKK
jgi:zinc protease